jgi:hypothetical protein
MFNKKQS